MSARDRNLSPDKAFVWTAKSEQAALLVAEDRLTNERIAAECGVSRRTLDSWKSHPTFETKVDSHVTAFAETVRKSGIGRLENRVRRLNEHWRGLQDVIAARAADALAQRAARERVIAAREERIARHVAAARELGASEAQIAAQLQDFPDVPREQVAPGMETGLVVRVETPGKFGVTVEYKVDTPTLAELRAQEQQAAKELGQWTEKKDVTSGGERLPAGPDLRRLSGERLAQLEEILTEAEGADTSQPSGG